MHLSVSPELCERFPTLTLGVAVARGITNGDSPAEVGELISREEQRIRGAFQKETFTEHPHIRVWREAYAAFGVKPKDAKSSIENLYRIILSGRDMRRISALVDVYNFISLKHMLPAGGEDLDAGRGDIELRVAGENEPPVKLLGDEAPESPAPGEIIYADSESAICRRWNWREADRTKLTEKTANALLVIEGIGTVGREKVEAAIEELAGMVPRYCGGSVRCGIITARDPFMNLD